MSCDARVRFRLQGPLNRAPSVQRAVELTIGGVRVKVLGGFVDGVFSVYLKPLLPGNVLPVTLEWRVRVIDKGGVTAVSARKRRQFLPGQTTLMPVSLRVSSEWLSTDGPLTLELETLYLAVHDSAYLLGLVGDAIGRPSFTRLVQENRDLRAELEGLRRDRGDREERTPHPTSARRTVRKRHDVPVEDIDIDVGLGRADEQSKRHDVALPPLPASPRPAATTAEDVGRYVDARLRGADRAALAALQAELSTWQRKVAAALEMLTECCVCLDKDACVLFAPCAHTVTCAACSKLVLSCPVCMSKIQNKTHVHHASYSSRSKASKESSTSPSPSPTSSSSSSSSSSSASL